MKIRDFIYLDNDRMYSLYSQIFKGISKNILTESHSGVSSENSALKKKSSEIATLIGEESFREIESKIMHDNLYTQLEDKLKNVIKIIDEDYDFSRVNEIEKSFIIKIVGNAFVNDYNRLEEFMAKFNKLGLVIAKSVYEAKNEMDKKNTTVKRVQETEGLSYNEDGLKDLKFVSEFFNKGSLEVVISPDVKNSNALFKGVLQRDSLRIDETSLRLLYGNEPNLKWTMVGQLTYVENINKENLIEKINSQTESSISDSFLNMIMTSTELERIFTSSKVFNKFHIAPIAIYVETELDIDVNTEEN